MLFLSVPTPPTNQGGTPMRRLSLLLLLIVLACAASLATAEKPYTLTDLATIPDSATTVEAMRFDWCERHSTREVGLLVPCMGGPIVSLPIPGITAVNVTPGRIKARIDAPIWAFQPLPWYARRCPVYRYFRSAWGLAGIRFQVANPRTVRSLHCRGRLCGDCHGLPLSLETLSVKGGTARVGYTAGYVLWQDNNTFGPYTGSRYQGDFPAAFTPGLPFSLTPPVRGDALFSAVSLDRPLDCTLTGRPSKDTVLEPGSWYLLAVALNLTTTAGLIGTLSDTDLDFYSGDHGAYFDSLEIELEPVKGPGKA